MIYIKTFIGTSKKTLLKKYVETLYILEFSSFKKMFLSMGTKIE